MEWRIERVTLTENNRDGRGGAEAAPTVASFIGRSDEADNRLSGAGLVGLLLARRPRVARRHRTAKRQGGRGGQHIPEEFAARIETMRWCPEAMIVVLEDAVKGLMDVKR